MKENKGIIWILTVGVFSIINTEMGLTGILPLIADNFHVSISKAGLLVSLFALIVAISGPTMPLIFSRFNRKKVMLLALGLFTISNIIAVFATSFAILLIARIAPAFLHPVYVSMAITVAGNSVEKKDAPKAIAKVMMGVSAGMVCGVPIVSFISRHTTLQVGMLFFAIVSGLCFLITLFYVPSMPVVEKLTYGSQVSILKKSTVWISFIGVMALNGSIFGVYSFVSDYLEKVTQLSGNAISFVLLLFGIANIMGNYIAGKLLSKNPIRMIAFFPGTLLGIYIVMLLLGNIGLVICILLFVWGILVGIAANINQYWMESAAPEAPDFSNGLFLAATNLGTTLATTMCGWFISGMGIDALVYGGVIFLLIAIIFIQIRIRGDK